MCFQPVAEIEGRGAGQPFAFPFFPLRNKQHPALLNQTHTTCPGMPKEREKRFFFKYLKKGEVIYRNKYVQEEITIGKSKSLKLQLAGQSLNNKRIRFAKTHTKVM